MRGALKLFRKDLLELLGNAMAMLLLLLLPSVILVLAGQLHSRSMRYSVLVAGAPDPSSGSSGTFVSLLDALEELEPLDLATRPEPVADPLSELRRGPFDLILNVEASDLESWRIYVGELEARRLNGLQRLVTDLDRLLWILHNEDAEGDEQDVAESNGGLDDAAGDDLGQWSAAEQVTRDARTPPDDPERWMTRLLALGAASPPRLFSYFPQAKDDRFDLVVRTMALLLCFIPFVLIAPSLIRERESSTLDLLLVAPDSGPTPIVAGKCLFALTVVSFNLAAFLILGEVLYGIHVKPGLPWILASLAAAGLSSALLGLATSALVNSQVQAMAVAAGYFISMLLFGNFLYPIEQSSSAISIMSHLFPLTFLRPLLRDWLLGVPPDVAFGSTGASLWVQAVVVAGLAVPIVVYRLRRE